MEIPQIIQQEANARGWRGVVYVGSSYGSLVFREVCGDDLPVGLPNVLVLDDNKVIDISGEQALVLLSFLDHS